jgi:hypothetical protein
MPTKKGTTLPAVNGPFFFAVTPKKKVVVIIHDVIE